jgi:hypothetical protein
VRFNVFTVHLRTQSCCPGLRSYLTGKGPCLSSISPASCGINHDTPMATLLLCAPSKGPCTFVGGYSEYVRPGCFRRGESFWQSPDIRPAQIFIREYEVQSVRWSDSTTRSRGTFTLKDFLAAVLFVLAPGRLHRNLRSGSHERPVNLTPQIGHTLDSITPEDFAFVGVVKMAGLMAWKAYE